MTFLQRARDMIDTLTPAPWRLDRGWGRIVDDEGNRLLALPSVYDYNYRAAEFVVEARKLLPFLVDEYESLLQKWYQTHTLNHRLLDEGAMHLKRNPHDLMPAVNAYADERISAGKLRECIKRWLAGADFTNPEEREWDHEQDPTG